ncbi:MAG: cobalt ECF transporter T component CbiQ [Methanosarcinaceae archaeon]|nr:cobalt ECF transporter T component CbiQ [Methanosarcinaceae archaeon]
MHNLDDIALLSPLRKKNTHLKMLIVLFCIIAGVLSPSPVTPLFIGVVMIFITLFFGKVPKKFYLKLLFATMGFAFISAVMIALFSGGILGDVIFSYKLFFINIVLTTNSLNHSILIFSRAFGGLCSIFFLSMTTPMLEMFSIMKRVKFLNTFSELVMLIYRYIFVFLELLINIRAAQTMRFGYDNTKSALNSLSMLVSSLFIKTMDQGDKLFLAMNSRCYEGKMKYFEPCYKITFTDTIAALVFVVSVIAVFYFTMNFRFF